MRLYAYEYVRLYAYRLIDLYVCTTQRLVAPNLERYLWIGAGLHCCTIAKRAINWCGLRVLCILR